MTEPAVIRTVLLLIPMYLFKNDCYNWFDTYFQEIKYLDIYQVSRYSLKISQYHFKAVPPGPEVLSEEQKHVESKKSTTLSSSPEDISSFLIRPGPFSTCCEDTDDSHNVSACPTGHLALDCPNHKTNCIIRPAPLGMGHLLALRRHLPW